jgi:Spy/CpxP family protein refolding chaperone
MKTLQFISVLLFLSIAINAFGQENAGAAAPQRTPEQEAMKQTDKLQQELNLTPEQAKQIYDINLRYARERMISNKRSEALERMKNKNAEIQQILSQEQNEKLQTKRYERTNTDPQTAIQNRPVNPPGFRSSADFRTNPTVRVTPNDVPVRSSFRTSTPASGTQNNSQPQTVKRSVTTEPAPRTNPSSVRQSVPTPTFVPRRTETPPTPTRK